MRGLWISTLLVCALPGIALADPEVRGELGVELRAFRKGDRPTAPDRTNASMRAQLELFGQWGDGRHAVKGTPFLRVDQRDARRTHADLRELNYQLLAGDYELTVGVTRVFWGVTESKHLVNVINQIDLVENLDRESFLGQPMVRFAWLSDLGTFELFGMALFRERTFPGVRGRPGLPVPIARDGQYQSSLGRYRPEVAVRYSHFFGPLDVGVAYFHGTNRDPSLQPAMDAAGPLLVPHYGVIHQASLDAQLTLGGFLWKLEALGRAGRWAGGEADDSAWAVTAGVEYTLVGLLGTRADLGLLAEYNWDQRDPLVAGFLEHDAFGGLRLALNDTQDTALLAGASVDTATGAVLVTAEAEHRLGETLSLSLQSFVIAHAPNAVPERPIERDSYLQVELAGYL